MHKPRVYLRIRGATWNGITWGNGKVLRMHDNGRVPTDNPIADHPHADKHILYRMTIADNKLIHMEVVVENLARIRDIEIDAAGIPYLLLKHASGGQIVRLLPATPKVASDLPGNAFAGKHQD